MTKAKGSPVLPGGPSKSKPAWLRDLGLDYAGFVLLSVSRLDHMQDAKRLTSPIRDDVTVHRFAGNYCSLRTFYE